MSGHSKWATIKRKKDATDAKRSNMYAKLLRAVEVAAREGGSGNIDGEHDARVGGREGARASRSRTTTSSARSSGGPARTSGGARYEELIYEGYAPGGVALFVEALTDNRNRTGQEIRHAFTRNNGNLGESGSVAWQFTRKGVIVVEKVGRARRGAAARGRARGRRRGPERLRELPGTSSRTRTAFTDGAAARSRPPASRCSRPSSRCCPQTTIPVDGGEAKQVLHLIEALEDLDDVQNVYANFDIPEEVMARSDDGRCPPRARTLD